MLISTSPHRLDTLIIRKRESVVVYNIYIYNTTNQENKGLISEDRRNKSTLPLTIPRSLYKSSAKDPVPAAKSEIAIRALGVTDQKYDS